MDVRPASAGRTSSRNNEPDWETSEAMGAYILRRGLYTIPVLVWGVYWSSFS